MDKPTERTAKSANESFLQRLHASHVAPLVGILTVIGIVITASAFVVSNYSKVDGRLQELEKARLRAETAENPPSPAVNYQITDLKHNIDGINTAVAQSQSTDRDILSRLGEMPATHSSCLPSFGAVAP